MPDGGPAVEVDGLTKRFGDVEAVRAATLDARPGEIVALLGPSGCGKTTLLRLIAGFERPDAGSLTIDGRHVAEALRQPVNAHARAQHPGEP